MKKIINRYLPVLYGNYLNLISFFSLKKAVLKALDIFSTPRKGKVLEHQSEYLKDAKDQLIDYNNKTIQTYKWSGNNKTILLAHGWESNSFRWRKLIKELQKHDYNIISMDAPSHGNSLGTTFNVLMYTECMEKLIAIYTPEIIIGHSLGGMTTIYHQYKHPNERIKKLIILAAPSELTKIMSDYQKLLRFRTKILKGIEALYIKRYGFNFSDFSSAKFSKNLKQKGLIIHDNQDIITPINESEAIHKNWKNSILFKTDELGHSLQDKKVYKKVIDFIAND